MKRYSLSDYILSIEPNDQTIKSLFGTISIGGEGSYTDSIRLSRTNNMWSTDGYATGAWVHNKNMSRVGTATLSINQMSPSVAKFIKLANAFYGADYDGFTLSLSDRSGTKVAECVDCYITTIPEQAFETSAGMQNWEFTCGQINFN